jgi:hypothetical protein
MSQSRRASATRPTAIVENPRRSTAPDTIPAELKLSALTYLSLKDIRRRLYRITGQVPRAGAPRFLLLRLLAYRIQTQVFGSLDEDSVAFLDRIEPMETPVTSSPATPEIAESPPGLLPVRSKCLAVGATLTRRWKGVVHHVKAVEHGFEWNGQRYASLTTVARVITGTDWSGPRFFGLSRLSGQADCGTHDEVDAGYPVLDDGLEGG